MALRLEVSFMKSTFRILVFSFSILTFICGCEKSTGPKKDTTPPAAITDLRIVTDTETPVTLAWTAPGDDGKKGSAVLYSIRYSTETAVLYEWHFASEVVDEPAPHPAGTAEEFVVGDLSPDSNYYFAIKSQDDAGNWSPLSNVAFSVPVAAGGIAFVSDRDGNLEIYVVSSEGSYLKNITQNEGDDWDPAWSWDRRIVFISDRGGGYSDIWMSSADGVYQGRLTSKSNWHCYHPVFSPNGYTITFQVVRYSPSQDSCDVYIVNSDGTGLANLTENSNPWDFDPVWSSDGAKIVFIHNIEIYVMDSDGSDHNRLTYNDDPEFSPMSSPGEGKILFLTLPYPTLVRDLLPGFREYGDYQLSVMNSDGSDRMILASAAYAAWSPDGSRIAYEQGKDIYVMNSDGTSKQQLTTDPACDGQPTWSPDGSKIAFVSDREGNEEIYVMNADGTNKINVSNNPGRDFSPVWAATPAPYWCYAWRN